MTEMPLKLFYCYAREDKTLLQELDKSLSSLKRENQIESFSDIQISPGKEWAKEIHFFLYTADIILLLISPDFVASEYCYHTEMKRAMERHECGKARVIPIILRPVDWRNMPFNKIQVLPSDGKPLIHWKDRDDAFLDICKGLRLVISELRDQLGSARIDTSFMSPRMLIRLTIPDPSSKIILTFEQWLLCMQVNERSTLQMACQQLGMPPDIVCRIAGELIAKRLIRLDYQDIKNIRVR